MRTWWRSVAFGLGFALLGASAVHACDCARAPVSRALAGARLVFVGRVVDVRLLTLVVYPADRADSMMARVLHQSVRPDTVRQWVVLLVPDEVFKGEPPDTIRTLTGLSSCDYFKGYDPPAIGSQHVAFIYTAPREPIVFSSVCGGSGPVEYEASELAFLRRTKRAG